MAVPPDQQSCNALFDLSDEELAANIAQRLAMSLPAPCIPGVAANVRLLKRHYDVMRKHAR